MTLNAKIEGFMDFGDFCLRHAFQVSRANCDEITIEIDRDSLCMKLSALNVVLTRA